MSRPGSALRLALVLLLAACASNEARDRMTTAHALSTDVTALVEFKLHPPDEPGTLAAVDAAVQNLLDKEQDRIVERALARYDRSRAEEQTRIERSHVELQRETPLTIAEEKSATRKELSGKVTSFRFTVRKANARLTPDPLRVELALACIEDSRAPSDTVGFPQDFRAELVAAVNRCTFEVLRARGLEPVEPRPAPVR